RHGPEAIRHQGQRSGSLLHGRGILSPAIWRPQMSGRESSDIPKEVLDVLKTAQIGYLSVKSEKGDLYTYPVAFLFSGRQVYTMTPISAAKLKFMRANPDVSFLVENKGLTLGAIGAMFQGRAKIYSITKTITSILSVGPNMAKYAKKYPSQFTF